MAKKAKAIRRTVKPKAERLTVKQRLVLERADGWAKGFDDGMREGMQKGRKEFLPPYESRAGLLDFVRAVESWPVNGDAVVAIIATDLKHICNLAVPARVLQAIAAEMKKRLA